jgi:GT2 family glycosyltransferase
VEEPARDLDGSPLVAVIVLLYNSGDVVARCLDALAGTRYRAMDVVVVDNGSTDGCARQASEHPLGPTVLRLGANLGWSGGNNAGIGHALCRGAEYVMLLNPDVVVTPDWLDAAVAAMEADTTIGILDYEGLDHPIDEHPPEPGAEGVGTGAVRDVEGAIGAALLARSSAVRRMGPLDDDYFLYFEDVDWSWRALDAGYRVVRLDHALWHESEGSSSESRMLLRSWLSMRNSIRVRVKLRRGSTLRWIIDLAIHARSRRTFVHKHLIRLRPYGPLRNLALVAGAVGWNLLHWVGSVRRARRERGYATSPWEPDC